MDFVRVPGFFDRGSSEFTFDRFFWIRQAIPTATTAPRLKVGTHFNGNMRDLKLESCLLSFEHELF